MPPTDPSASLPAPAIDIAPPTRPRARRAKPSTSSASAPSPAPSEAALAEAAEIIAGLGKPGEAAAIFVDIATIKPWPDNPKKITDDEVRELADSMLTFGFGRPLAARSVENPELIIGHKSFMAAKLLGLPVVPVRFMPHLSAEQAHALAVLDNQLAMKGKWQTDGLRAALLEARSAQIPLSLLGFSPQKLDRLLAERASASARVTEIPVSAVRTEFWLSLRGDLTTQPAVLEVLKQHLGQIPGITLNIGVIKR